jgi:hypothetical protein
MRAHLFPSIQDGPGQTLCEYAFLNDMPADLRHIKRPVEEVKLLVQAMKDIALYLDGLEDRYILLDAREKVEDAIYGPKEKD